MASVDRAKVSQGIERALEWHQRGRELVDEWQRMRAGICRRCGEPAGTMKTLCSACAAQRKVARRDYRRAAEQRRSASSTSIQQWVELNRWVGSQGFGLDEVAGSNNPAAGHWLATFVDLVIATGSVDDDDVAQFEASAALLPVDAETIAGQRNRMIRAKWFLDLQHGRLPVVPTDARLADGEVCHLDAPVTVLSLRGNSGIGPARLILTNHRLILGSRELPLIAVRRAVPYRGGVRLEPSTDSYFVVHDPQWVVALINAATQVARGAFAAPAHMDAAGSAARAFASAATALEQDGRADDATMIRALADQWEQLPAEQQVRAERAAEAIRGTYAVLHKLPQAARSTARADGFSPAQSAELSIDNSLRALSAIMLSEYDQHADELAAMRNYTAQWSDDGALKL